MSTLPQTNFDTGEARVLLVEPDEDQRFSMASVLEKTGYQVHAEPNGTALARLAAEFRPDLAVLNVYCDTPPCGYAMTRALRRSSDLPTLLVLNKHDAMDLRLYGLEVGADQLIFRPFSASELAARVGTMLRRTGRGHLSSLAVGDVVVNEASNTATREGVPVNLTRREFELLVALARHVDRVLSKDRLSILAWGDSQWGNSTLATHMSSLRRKLEQLGPRMIHTAHGFGYVLKRP